MWKMSELTDDERYHGSPIPSRGFKTLDELLDLPYFNILFGFVLLGSTHDCGKVPVTWLARTL